MLSAIIGDNVWLDDSEPRRFVATVVELHQISRLNCGAKGALVHICLVRPRVWPRVYPWQVILSMAFPVQFVALARRAAAAQSLDPALVCAVVEQESAWNPWAMRYEPLFFAKYVASLYPNNKISASEGYALGLSWGLMQVMGQVSRESAF